MTESILTIPGYLLRNSSISGQIASTVGAFGAVYAIRRCFASSPLVSIPGPPSPSLLTGHLLQLTSAKGGIDFCHTITEEYGEVVKLKSLFGSEILYISDPLALYHIQKDTAVWQKPPYMDILNDLLFGPGVLSSHGDAHRRQRKMLNPIFAAPYLRKLTPILYAVAYQLRDVVKFQIHLQGESVNMLNPLAQAALELIGQAGLGHTFGALQGQSDTYVKAAEEIMPALMGVSVMIPFLPFLTKLGSSSFRRKVVDCLPWGAAHHVFRLVDDMDHVTFQIYQHKKKLMGGLEGFEGPSSSVGDGQDLITQLLKANASAPASDKLPEEQISAQLNTLLFTASDTTSGALSRILHLLSTHQDVQDRLRDEIVTAQQANEGHDLDYQALDDLRLLSAVVRETLRLHPTSAHVARISTTDDVVPLRYPITSTNGKKIESIYIPKGTEVYLAMLSANSSTRIWGNDAKEWKPDRWLNPLPTSTTDAKIPGVVPGLMTFLNGTRSCLGYQFALQEMKIVLCVLLESFKFTPDVDIEWHSGLMMTPYAVGNDLDPQLPLRVEYIGAKS